jgi:hypothetical protein
VAEKVGFRANLIAFRSNWQGSLTIGCCRHCIGARGTCRCAKEWQEVPHSHIWLPGEVALLL